MKNDAIVRNGEGEVLGGQAQVGPHIVHHPQQADRNEPPVDGMEGNETMNVSEYLYMVLVPCAEAFREQFDGDKRRMKAVKSARSCRVEFLDKATEKKWVEWCKKHDLKNDPSLEY